MKGRKTWQLGYLAGVMDSDGCIVIGKHNNMVKGKIYPHYRLEMIVNQVDGRTVDYLYGTFGGYIHIRTAKANSKNQKITLYRWEMRGDKAAKLLKQIIPFLKIKKEQAELAVQFQSMMKPRNQNSADNSWTKEKSEILYKRMRGLKINYYASAAAETKCNDSRNGEAIVQTLENNNQGAN